MKRNLILIFALIYSSLAFSQEIIKEAKISFELPNKEWKLIDKEFKNGRTLYSFKRTPLIDSEKRNIIANISIIIEKVKKGSDLMMYSANKRSSAPFKVLEVFTHEDGYLGLEYAIGYKGSYSDQNGEHKIYVIHSIHKNKGIQIHCDVTEDLYDSIVKEFKDALKSFKIND